MKYESSRLRALATSSQRLNKMLLLLTSLALLLVSMSYWAVGRVFEEESDKVDFHFARLIESIHEHESFLKLAAQGYSRAHQNVVTHVQPFSSKLIMLGDDEEVYQVKGLAMSIPFTLAKRNEYSDEAMRGALSWGVQLTDFYSSFWASSFYSSPQLFMFSPSPQFNVAIPGVGSSRRQLQERLMPRMNGYELAARLRELNSSIPIIGATANAMLEEADRCRAAGMNQCLIKPFSMRALYTCLLAYKRNADEAL